MKKVIPPEQAEAMGISTLHEEMENGERRFRLKCSDGTAYIRTAASGDSGWQKSHFHKSVLETYIVQRGRIALVEWVDNSIRARVFCESDIVTTVPGIPHNVYMFSNSIIHTVKHGNEGSVSDWHGVQKLDEKTLHLSEDDLVRLAKFHEP